MSTQYIGSRVSLISQNLVRYEGILYNIDPVKLEVLLHNVQSFGTEDRETENPIEPSPNVYGYIAFSGADIKELNVCEQPTTEESGIPGGMPGQMGDMGYGNHFGYNPQGYMMGPYGQFGYGRPYPQYGYGGYMDPMGGMPGQMGGMPGQMGGMPGQMGGMPGYYGMYPNQMSEMQQFHNQNESQNESLENLNTQDQNNSQETKSIPSSPKHEEVISAKEIKTLNDPDSNIDNLKKETKEKKEEISKEPKKQNKNEKGSSQESSNDLSESNQKQTNSQANRKNRYRKNRGNYKQYNRGNKTKSTTNYSEDFDFESSLAKFDKEKFTAEINDKGENEDEEESLNPHYEKSSFFDSISCEATDREQQDKSTDYRANLKQQRKLDSETFGDTRTNRGRGRNNRGRRGGYRGYYRKRKNNNNYNNNNNSNNNNEKTKETSNTST